MNYILYADETYAKSSKEDKPQNIHLFGGIVVNRETEDLIVNEIREIKRRYTHPNMPIKWNFKDNSIKKKYEEFKRANDYEKMLAESRDWRLELFQKISKLDYTIIVSCIEANPSEEKTPRDIKNDLNTYCFENVLMRAGLDAKKIGGKWQCVLDWPPDNDSKPFDRGYYKLFHFGKASSPDPAICGPLEKLGFSHSLHYTRTNHSPVMQLTDLVLGATRDHIECKIQGRHSSVGSECVELFYDHYRNSNGTIPRYGVSASTRSTVLLNHIKSIYSKETKPI